MKLCREKSNDDGGGRKKKKKKKKKRETEAKMEGQAEIR